MTALVLDIETLPVRPVMNAMNWRHPREQKTHEWLEEHAKVKPGLHPLFSEVAVISYDHDRGLPSNTKDALQHGTERDMLHSLLEELEGLRSATLVTYNGFGFDLPMLQQRLRLHGLPRLRWEENPWRHGLGNHYDVMLALAGGAKDRFPYVPLDVAYAVVLDEEPPERPDLETAQAAWYRGDPVPLRTRCEADVRMTGELYERVVGR